MKLLGIAALGIALGAEGKIAAEYRVYYPCQSSRRAAAVKMYFSFRYYFFKFYHSLERFGKLTVVFA